MDVMVYLSCPDKATRSMPAGLVESLHTIMANHVALVEFYSTNQLCVSSLIEFFYSCFVDIEGTIIEQHKDNLFWPVLFKAKVLTVFNAMELHRQEGSHRRLY